MCSPAMQLDFGRLTLGSHRTAPALPQVEEWEKEVINGVTIAPGMGQVIADSAEAMIPTSAETAAARDAVNAVVLRAVHALGVVDRTCVDGSFGRKTSVRGDIDVDMVLFVNGPLTPQKREEIFARLSDLLRQLEARQGWELRKLHVLETPKPPIMKFDMRRPGATWVPFDIGLAQNLVLEQPREGQEKMELQRQRMVQRLLQLEVRDAEHRMEDDEAVAESMLYLIAAAPGQVNHAVQLAKVWAKYLFQQKRFARSTKAPLSVLLELLVVHAWHASQAVPEYSRGINTAKCLVAFYDILSLVARRQREVIITKYYTRGQAESSRHLWRGNQVPVVVHPCNPTNNLCLAHGFNDWAALAEQAAQQAAILRSGTVQELKGSALGLAVHKI